MTPARAAATLAGLAVVVALVARLPADAFEATRVALLVAAGALLLLMAASVFLVPARRAQARLFMGPPPPEGGAFGLPSAEEARVLARPAVVVATCLAVAGFAAALR